jgi:hypothetical protein
VAIEHIHSYLVHPGKRSGGKSQISGADVALGGKVFELLNGIYLKSDLECNIEISFNQSRSGAQQNPCRDLLLSYVGKPTLDGGRAIAERLQDATDHRSGLGLLFLISGQEDPQHKIVISRFPADSAILAEEDQRALSVAFLEQVFMKSASGYKAAAYQDSSVSAGFWLGRAVDKQINNRAVQLSNYWIHDFLDSDFRTTAAAGTKRLAISLRDAAKRANHVSVKTEIAAVTLAGSLQGRTLSIRDFENQFGLSAPARQSIAKEIKAPSLLDERFQFDRDEFRKHVAYRSVELNTGGILTAESSNFDRVFRREALDDTEQRVRFSTEGRVVSEKLGKTK